MRRLNISGVSASRRTAKRASLSSAAVLAAAAFVGAAAVALAPSPAWCQAGEPPVETIEINAQAPAHPFPHFWEQMFGSGRAILSLRESYRNDLRSV